MQELSRRLLILLGIIFSSLLITQCEHPEIIDPFWSFGGVVTDSISGNPIESAWVSYDDTIVKPRVYSDSTGNYRHALFGDPHPIRVFCGKTGYSTVDRMIYPKGRAVDSVDFKL